LDKPRGTPTPEIELDPDQARALLSAQFPDLASLSIHPLGSGWDNVMYRLGRRHVMRLPRRAVAVPLLAHEQRWLPQIQGFLPIKIPAPTHIGVPAEGYPWPWSVSQWIDGETADLAQPDGAQGIPLAAFLRALHVPAPRDAPRNVYRGVALSQRLAKFDECAARVTRQSSALQSQHLALWQRALAAPRDTAETWIHGDLHPRNVLIDGGQLAGVIDWGDMAQGDPATDLASLWMLLPELYSRHEAMARLPVSGPTWDRARGWALLFAVILLDSGLAGDVRMSVIAERTLRNLLHGP
jgi:aminoglycoside phosphotransferase (APT) family kinase protein